MTMVHLMRHGETVWNALGKLQGQADIALSETGRAQVAAQRGALRDETLHVVSSDLARATESAQLMGFHDVATDTRLREINVGSWEGRAIAQLVHENEANYKAWRAGRFTPPDGEAWDAFCARTTAALLEHAATAAAQDAALLLVCHGGVIRSILDHLLALPPERFEPAKPASLSALLLEGQPRLVSYNRYVPA